MLAVEGVDVVLAQGAAGGELAGALLAAVVAFYQVAGGLFEWVWTGSFAVAVQDFRLGLPGLLLQIAGGWLVINRLPNR